MTRRKRFPYLFVLLAIAALLNVSCGSDDSENGNTPAPSPTAPTTTPTPSTTPPSQSANCATITGHSNLRADNTPFQGLLNTQSYIPVNASLSVNVMYQSAPSADVFTNPVVGTAMLSLSDWSYLFGYAVSAVPSSICVSSKDPVTLQDLPATYYNSDKRVQMILRGTVAYATTSYYGQTQNNQALIEVRIGYACMAYLYQGRISGCVEVFSWRGNRPAMIFISR